MKLKTKLMNWSAGRPVAILHIDTSEKVGAHVNERISIKIDSKEVIAIVDTGTKFVRENEIAVSSEIQERLKLKAGQLVDVVLAPNPESIIFIKKKLKNHTLSEKEISSIINDIVDNSLSEAEISFFVSAMYKYEMNFKETVALIKAISESGEKLNIKGKLIADKHSIGGVAGNRTTPIIVPICAAAGLTMPKTSSRAITSPAGTADVIETLARVEFSAKEIKKIIKKTNACMVWCGALGLVPADNKIIKVERMIGIDPTAQLLSSILSKKLAVGSKYILIDIPYGKFAKVNKKKALELKRKFMQLGKYFNKKIKCVLSDGNEPVGNGIGPVLEMIDVLKILKNQNGPSDLEKKSLFLSGQLLELTGKSKTGEGEKIAGEMLHSKKAFKKFKQIIKAQGGSLKRLKPARFGHDFFSKKSGKITEINNQAINELAKVAGCPADKAAGIYIYFHVGDRIKKKEKILTIYAESKSRLKEAVKFYKENKIISVK